MDEPRICDDFPVGLRIQENKSRAEPVQCRSAPVPSQDFPVSRVWQEYNGANGWMVAPVGPLIATQAWGMAAIRP